VVSLRNEHLGADKQTQEENRRHRDMEPEGQAHDLLAGGNTKVAADETKLLRGEDQDGDAEDDQPVPNAKRCHRNAL
jgi:hypothetical protein